jgi:DNA-binding transcriptional regulator YdaS (Cro superfamily)
MKTQEAADFFGSKSKLAKAIGIFPSAITQWGETVPLLRQYQIQSITKGKLKAAASAGKPAA